MLKWIKHRMMSDSLLAALTIVLIGGLILLLLSPYIGFPFFENGNVFADYLSFFQKIADGQSSVLDTSGTQISHEIGTNGDSFGLINPLIAIVAALLTFLAFWIQYQANNKIEKRDNIKHIKNLQSEHFQILNSIKLYDRECGGAADYELPNGQHKLNDLKCAVRITSKVETLQREGTEALYTMYTKWFLINLSNNFENLPDDSKGNDCKSAYQKMSKNYSYLFAHYHFHALFVLQSIEESMLDDEEKKSLGRQFLETLSIVERIMLCCFIEFGVEIFFDEKKQIFYKRLAYNYDCSANIDVLQVLNPPNCVNFGKYIKKMFD